MTALLPCPSCPGEMATANKEQGKYSFEGYLRFDCPNCRSVFFRLDETMYMDVNCPASPPKEE